jgi:hypothetical protein
VRLAWATRFTSIWIGLAIHQQYHGYTPLESKVELLLGEAAAARRAALRFVKDRAGAVFGYAGPDRISVMTSSVR